jgi:hypothetical protein
MTPLMYVYVYVSSALGTCPAPRTQSRGYH